MMGGQARTADGSGWLERLASRERGPQESRASLRPRLPYAFESRQATPGELAPPAAGDAGEPAALRRVDGSVDGSIDGTGGRGQRPPVPPPPDDAGHVEADAAMHGNAAPATAAARADVSARSATGVVFPPAEADHPPALRKQRQGSYAQAESRAPERAPVPAPAATKRVQATPQQAALPPSPTGLPVSPQLPATHTRRAAVPGDTFVDTHGSAAMEGSIRPVPETGIPGSTPAMREADSILPPLAPHDATPPEAVIEIHIGRIDINAQGVPAGKKGAQGAAQPAPDPLATYLGRRSRGARS